MGLVIPFIPDFERHVPRQFALDDHIPLVHQWIAKIRLDATERHSRVLGKRAEGESTREAAGEKVAVEALWLADTNEGAVALIAGQVDRFIKRNAFAAVGAATLVFFAAVE